MASTAFVGPETQYGSGSAPYNRQKPIPEERVCRGLCLLPAGMRMFSSQNARRIWLRYNVWLLLTMLAVGGGTVAFLNEYSISWLTKIHQKTINNSKFSEPVKFALWSSWTLGCVVLSCICVALSDSHAAEGTSVILSFVTLKTRVACSDHLSLERHQPFIEVPARLKRGIALKTDSRFVFRLQALVWPW